MANCEVASEGDLGGIVDTDSNPVSARCESSISFIEPQVLPSFALKSFRVIQTSCSVFNYFGCAGLVR